MQLFLIEAKSKVLRAAGFRQEALRESIENVVDFQNKTTYSIQTFNHVYLVS